MRRVRRQPRFEAHFVRTPEFDETVQDFKEMFELMKDPKAVVEGILIAFTMFTIYFGSIILADLMNIPQ